MVGLNPSAQRASRHRVPFYVALSLILGGAFAGLAGAVEVTGLHHRMLEGMSGGYGFSGIVAALFGKLHPLGLIPASFFFGGLLVGADKMQRAIQVPSALITAINGLVVMFVVGSDLYVRRAKRRYSAEATMQQSIESSTPPAGPATGMAVAPDRSPSLP